MDRAELRQLAEDRVLDAEALLNAGRWSAAYYLAGYAIECGLKACVLAFVENHPGIVLEDRRLSDKCFSHDIEGLVKVAGLEAGRDAGIAANPVWGISWQVIKSWNEKSRYQQKSEAQARTLFGAITDPINGVLPWIRVRW